MRPQPTTDYLGLGLALLAALCWAAYILLNRVIGQRIAGAQGSAAAAGISAAIYLPIGIAIFVRHPPTAAAFGCAMAAGVLSSALPYLADLFILRRVPTQAFGLFMSVNPVMAALVGVILLRQELAWIEWASIGAIVAANAISILTQRAAPPAAGHAHSPVREPSPLDIAHSQEIPGGVGVAEAGGFLDVAGEGARAVGPAAVAADVQRLGARLEHGRRAAPAEAVAAVPAPLPRLNCADWGSRGCALGAEAGRLAQRRDDGPDGLRAQASVPPRPWTARRRTGRRPPGRCFPSGRCG